MMVKVTVYGIGCSRHKALLTRLERISRRVAASVELSEVTTIEGILERQIPGIPAVDIGGELHVVDGPVWEEDQLERWICEIAGSGC